MTIEKTRPTSMMTVSRSIAELMKEVRDRDSSASLMQQFGISYNTWRKIQAGDPVRESVAKRLLADPRWKLAAHAQSSRSSYSPEALGASRAN